MSWRRVALFTTLPLIALLARPAHAQVLYGSIVGNVTDASKAAVPDAKVKLTQVETNQAHEVTTNQAGAYVYNDAAAGTYQVVISKDGFQNFTARVAVQTNSVTRVDATLAIGTANQTVEVTAEAAALQTDRADVHTETTAAALENIPVSNRSYQSLMVMTPGVTQPSYYQTGGINNPTRSMAYNVNGTPNTDVVVRIDGISATNQWIQQLQAYTPGIESIDTINSVSSSFDAEQGLAGGASVNVFVKSGTNDMHGSLFEYVTNAALRARGFFLPAADPKIKDDKNVFGGTVGGPIKKNKLFYFGSWEETRENSGAASPYALQNGSTGNFLTIPNSTLRTGNFAGTGTTIYDPTTGTATGTGRQPFPNDAIPANRLSTISQAMLTYLPMPQTGGSVNNYFSVPEYNTVYQKYDAKVNWTVNNKLNLYSRFGYAPSHETASGYYPGPLNPLSLGGLGTGNIVTVSAGGTYTFTPTLIMDGVVGFTRQHTTQTPIGPNTCWGQFFGIPNACQPPGQRDTALEAISMTGFSPYGNTTYLSSLFDYLDPQYEGVLNFTWTKGSHNIRFGGDLHRMDINHSETGIETMTFTGGVSALSGGPSPNMYNSFADFLLGQPQSSSTAEDSPPLNSGANPIRPATLRTWQQALFVRDQWQVSRKLTMSVGLRWEYYPVPTRADRGIELFNFSINKIELCGVGGNGEDCGIHVSPKLFAPRIGLAFRPVESFVIRTGFSLNYEQDSMITNTGTYAFPEEVTISNVGANTYSPAATNIAATPTTQATGFNPFPQLNLAAGTISLPAGAGTYTVPQNYVRGYIMSWNFTLQKSLAHNFTLQAGYVGTRAIHQVQPQNINYGEPGGGVASQPFFQSIGVTSSMSVLLPMNHTFYDALQTTLTKRLSSGLTISANYSYSKSLSRFAGSIPIPQYFRLNYGLNSIDVPNHFVFATSYQLPFGKGKPFLSKGGILTAIAGGWQISTLFSAFSGSVFSVSGSSASLNSPGSSQRANQVLPNVQILGSPSEYFNVLAFQQPTCVCFGTAGFNTLRGPFAVDWDQSLFRHFQLNERFNLEFRAEGFNMANTPHFANPAANVSSLQLNSAGQVLNQNGFGVITTVNTLGHDFDERYFRLGMRLSF